MATMDITRSKAVHELLQKHSDAYGVSYVLSKIKYEKKPGKWKGCVLLATALNIYVLKDDTHKVITMFPIECCVPKVAGDKMSLTPTADAPATCTQALNLHGQRDLLYEAVQRINELAAKLRESATIPTAAPPDTNDITAHTGSVSEAASHTDDGASSPSPTHSRPSPSHRTRESATVSHDRRFLISNIASCESRDYSAIRSVYNMSEKDGRKDGQESRRLVSQLKAYIEHEKEDVEKVVSLQARGFMSAVEECPALQPECTKGLRDKLDYVTEKVSAASAELLGAGCGVVTAKLEYTNLSLALGEIEQCRKAAALHHRAELLIKEKKYYPALLASQELEAKVRPLVHHKYGHWVFYEVVPEIRVRVRSTVQRDFNAWLTTARKMAELFGAKALRWAEERILYGNATEQRRVTLVEEDEEGFDTMSHNKSSRPPNSRRMSGGSQDSTVANHDDDWADELLWDVETLDSRPQHALGAAQFLESLSDVMTNPEASECLSAEVPLRAVHTTQRIYKFLDPSQGEANLRKYYITNRKKQLELILQHCKLDRNNPTSPTQNGKSFPLGGADQGTLMWLSKLTGFFLVDLVVMKSTHPPLTHEFHIQGLWEETVLRIQKWLVEYSKADTHSWEDVMLVKECVKKMAVALEDLWAIGEESTHRLAPLYEGITRLEQSALQLLHTSTMERIDTILAAEKYHIIALQNPKPDEEQFRRYFLHLSSCAGGVSTTASSLPKCSDTVVKVVEEMMKALEAAFRIHSGARDADDEVRGHVEALLQHVACQLDERTGKLGQIHTTQILINSVNAGAYDAAALALAQTFAIKASSNHVHDARLKVFSSSRCRLRDCQRRFEDRGAALLQNQVKSYLSPLQASMWINHNVDRAPLMEITLDQYLQSNWARREKHLTPLTARRMKCIETGEVDKCLVSLAATLACADTIPNGKRVPALLCLAKDVEFLTQSCTQFHVNFPAFTAQLQPIIAQAEKMDQLAPALQQTPRELPQPEVGKKSEGGFLNRFKKKVNQ